MGNIRARTQVDKNYKRSLIVDTARQLYLNDTNSLPSVSLIANECKIAKGSIYNYFRTKEEIFLDILLDEYKKWFYDVSTLKFKQDDIHRLLYKDFLRNQLLLEIASISRSKLEKNIKREKLIMFKEFKDNHIEILSEKIAKDSLLTKNQVITKLMQSFSVIIGFYQTTQYDAKFQDFEDSVSDVLFKIWK